MMGAQALVKMGRPWGEEREEERSMWGGTGGTAATTSSPIVKALLGPYGQEDQKGFGQ